MSRKRAFLSLSGMIAIVHLCLFLALVFYQRSLVGPDGTIFVDEGTRPKVEFVETATLVQMFPIGWLSFIFTSRHPTSADVILTIGFVVANSIFVGFVLARLVRFVCCRRK